MRPWIHDAINKLTICQRAVVGLRIEVNFNHLTPSSCDQHTVQLFCVFTPSVCVDSSCYAPTVDDIEMRGVKIEPVVRVRSKAICSIVLRCLSPLVQVINLEV